WTHYRGMMAIMIYHCLHCVVQDMTLSTERALANLQLTISKKPKNNSKKAPPLSPREPKPEPDPIPDPTPPDNPVEFPAWIEGMLGSLKWCLYCKKAPYDCVALPCGHVASCQKCLKVKRRCAWCSLHVKTIQPITIV